MKGAVAQTTHGSDASKAGYCNRTYQLFAPASCRVLSEYLEIYTSNLEFLDTISRFRGTSEFHLFVSQVVIDYASGTSCTMNRWLVEAYLCTHTDVRSEDIQIWWRRFSDVATKAKGM